MIFLPGNPWRRHFSRNFSLSDIKNALYAALLGNNELIDPIFKGIHSLSEKEQILILEENYSRYLNQICQDITGKRVVDMMDRLAVNPDMSDEIINFMQMQQFSPVMQKMYEDAAFRNAMISAYTNYAKETDNIIAIYTREEAQKMGAFPGFEDYYLGTNKKIGVIPKFVDFVQDPDIINILSERKGYSGNFYSVYFDKQKDIEFFETVREARKNGDSIASMTEQLYNKWNTGIDEGIGSGAIENVVRTEISRARAEGSVLADRKSGYIVAYKFFNAIDGRTTDICEMRDGLLLDANNDEVMSKNTPPLHYQCRSSLIPLSEAALEDEGGWEQLEADTHYILSLPEFEW